MRKLLRSLMRLLSNTKGFANEIGKLSIATRTESGLLAEGLYQTISSGITDTSDAFKVLETSANAARAGLTSVDVAVDAVTSAINAYGLQASDAKRISDAYFKTVEVGKLRFEDIGRSIGNVAPLASQLGVGLEELLAAGSALTLTGKTLSESFTGIRGAMTAILRPSSEASDLAAELGIDFSAAALKTKGFEGFLKDLAVQTGGSTEVLGKFFGEVEGLQAVLSLTGNQAETFSSSLRSIENAAGSAEKAVAIQNQTFQAQIDLLNTQFSEALRSVGQAALPSVTSAVESLTTALSGVDWEQFRSDAESVIKTMVNLVKVSRELLGIATGFNFVRTLDRLPLATETDFGNTPTSPDAVRRNIAGGGGGLVNIDQAFADFQRRTQQALGISATDARRLGLDVPSGAQPTAPLPTAQPTGATRAIPLTPEQQDLAAQALAVSPDFIRSPAARQARSFRTGGQAGFVAPRAGTGIEAVTRAPIPGVRGELLAPGLGIAEPSPASIVSDNLQPLADLTFPTTLPEELKTFEDALKNANTAQLGAFEAL